MTKWRWDLPRFDSLENMDFRNLTGLQMFFLISTFLNLLSVLVNAAAGNLLWVVIGCLCIASNIWFLEMDHKSK